MRPSSRLTNTAVFFRVAPLVTFEIKKTKQPQKYDNYIEMDRGSLL